jgi:hypothetical protein
MGHSQSTGSTSAAMTTMTPINCSQVSKINKFGQGAFWKSMERPNASEVRYCNTYNPKINTNSDTNSKVASKVPLFLVFIYVETMKIQ